jgi:hypothetical protein
MKTLRTRLTFANAMSCLALFVALGGFAVAAGLPKNTVGAKQLRKNAVTTAKLKNEAVTGAKVKKGTLTGTQINLASIGTVPNAANAQALDGQSASQLAIASRLHCPSGMALYDGVCYQEATHKAARWDAAAIECWEEQLRLPTLGELMSFEYNNLPVAPVGEWTEPEWFTASGTLAWVGSAAKSGERSWGHVLTEGSSPYRCVTLASN